MLYITQKLISRHFLWFALVVSSATLAACSSQLEQQQKWRVKDLARSPYTKIRLTDKNEHVVAVVDTFTMKKLLLAKLRITRLAGIQAELFIEEGKQPNAFAGYAKVPGYGGKGKPIMGITTGMLKLLDDDTDAAAFLLGHEIAHFTKNHHDSARTRGQTLQAAGMAAAYGMAAAGVPMSGSITDLAVDLIDSAYGRDQEREADAIGMEYVIAAGYKPQGAIRLHEKLNEAGGETSIPFLSTHPGYKERIQNLKTLMEKKNPNTGLRSSGNL